MPVEFQFLAPRKPLDVAVYYAPEAHEINPLRSFAADGKDAAFGLHAAIAERKLHVAPVGRPFGGHLVGEVLAELLEIFRG